MTLVVKEGETWFRVAVHRAVIMPLCTYLKEIEKDVTKEEPVVILPDVPLELVEALIRLIYKGFAPMSEVVTVENLLLLMRMLGLTMPAERLIVTREKVEDEVEIIGFKNLYGLEIFEMKAGREKESLPLTKRRRSLEITPCGTSATQDNKKRRRRLQVLRTSSKSRDSFGPTSVMNDNNLKTNAENDEVVEDINVSLIPLQVKLECEEVEDVPLCDSKKIHREECDVSDSAVKKRRFSRRRKSDLPTLACELCDFNCRYVKDMQKHYDENHCSNENMCTLCGFKASTMGGLRIHIARKHNVGKNTVKLVEGGEKLAEAGPFALNDENIVNNNSEEDLANDVITRKKEDYSMEDDNVAMTLECINAEESVKAIVGDETKKDYSMDNLSSFTNAPHVDAALSVKLKDNSNTSTKMREVEKKCADRGKGEMHDGSANKIVENSCESIAASASKDNEVGDDEKSSVELFNNEKYGKKNSLGQMEEDPLTILKNVKAAHVKSKVRIPKGRGKQTAKPIDGVQVKKDELKDDKVINTEDVNTEKMDQIVREETNML